MIAAPRCRMRGDHRPQCRGLCMVGFFLATRVAAVMRLCRPALFVLSLVPCAVFGAWQTANEAATDAGQGAFVVNDAAQRLELDVDAHGTVRLRFRLNDGFETFSPSNCPTFQIDEREPMHHFNVGERCLLEPKHATFALGQIADRKMDSLILHRVLNGNAITFRYTVTGGQYRAARFTLSGSKRALRGTLGFNLQVSPNDAQ